jgi:hypothetical protein
MKVKESKIAFISFYLLFRIGTFQWVMAKKSKKMRLGLNSRGGLWSGVFPSVSSSVERQETPRTVR